MNVSRACDHCGGPVPASVELTVNRDGTDRLVCCPGCKAAAELLDGAGLREWAPTTGEDEWTAYDRIATQSRFVATDKQGVSETALLFEGVRCAACSWLIEDTLRKIPGVVEISVNPATARGRLRWRGDSVPLSLMLRVLADLGYRPHPIRADAADEAFVAEKRSAIRRLGVAGLGMMQVMMFSVGIYFAGPGTMDEDLQKFLTGVSLLVATPVVLYSGLPFFTAAWRDLRNRSLGMDVPVSLAVGGAYVASVWNTLWGSGEVYFDSVTMFVFFLSIGRFLEMLARHRAGAAADALAQLVPDTARLVTAGGTTVVAIDELEPGNVVSVPEGETVPSDGTVLEGESSLDESLLTGESRPIRRGVGDPVIGGSVNLMQPLKVRIDKTGANTVVSHIGRLLHRAQTERPQLAQLADRVAGYFVGFVLLATALIGAWWWLNEPAKAFTIVLAVLVATCPCALSLATPAAFTAATNALARRGVLVTRGRALETLARVSRFIFDKTGTLTHGRVSLVRTKTLGDLAETRCLTIAAALEAQSTHPIATAFRDYAGSDTADDVRVVAGSGIEGVVDGIMYRIGTPDFVGAMINKPLTIPHSDPGATIMLGSAAGPLAVFEIADELRDEARDTIDGIRALGLHPEIASGDAPVIVRRIAERLDIADYRGWMKPETKLEHIRTLQEAGECIAMVGDGVNDAPVLAGSDVSVAMGTGTPLAQTTADVVMMGASLEPLLEGVHTARATMRVVRQNLTWALIYNASVLPLAAAGFIAPWMAAIGMSASSLLVVLNALRLSRGTTAEPSEPGVTGADVPQATGI